MEDSAESLGDRRENELQMLEAIYINDVIDLRKHDAWKVARPPELKINLRPQESMSGNETHTSLSLHVKCHIEYPNQVPTLELEDIKGLSKQQTNKLYDELTELAASSKGEVMILQLCQHAQEFLHQHNRPPAPSFHEAMLANKRKQEAILEEEARMRKEQRLREQQKQIEAVEEELQKRKEETRRRKTESQMSQEDDEEKSDSFHKPGILRQRSRTLSDGRASSPSRNERGRNEPSGTKVTKIKDKTVLRGQCIGHSARGSAVYVCIDQSTGELLALTEWLIRWRDATKRKQTKDDTDAAKFMSQVKSVESEFNACVKLSHENLLPYRGFTCIQQPGNILVHVLTEFAGGGSLVQYIQKPDTLPMQQLQRYTSQTLDALYYLHAKSITHKDLKFSSLLLDSGGNIQLADYSINRRLSEIVSRAEYTQRSVQFAEDSEDSLPSLGKGGKKSDIYRLGVIFLSLAEGALVKERFVRPSHKVPEALRDFLLHCLEQDERLRWSAGQLREHDFIKTPLTSQLNPPRKLTEQCNGLDNQDMAEEVREEDVEDISYIPPVDSGSRLHTEFKILQLLGKGAFGDVIKVQNKLDGRLYAIKQIPLNPERKLLKRKITREVKLLSRLNHENVVRYYNSWIEASNEPALTDSSASTSTVQESTPSAGKPPAKDSSLGFGIPKIEDHIPPPLSDSQDDWSSAPSDDVTDDVSSDDDDDAGDVFGASFMPSIFDSDDDVMFEGEADSIDWEESETGEKSEESKLAVSKDSSRPCLQLLYIQMEFCEKSTLRNSIDNGLYLDTKRMWRLFREIIEGLVHIHEQGMIHRDLKPVNIFLDSNDQVKIGDFGLATKGILKPSDSHVDFSKNASASLDGARASGSEGDGVDGMTGDGGGLTGQVGTALYVSPEIMDASSKLHYSQKVDVYSLGMIFFEMCYRPLGTAMERMQIMGNLRKPEIMLPRDFDAQGMPKQTLILKWLLQHDPGKRPTSRELVQSEHLPVQEAELTSILKNAIANPQKRTYRRILDAMFSQPPQEVTSILYDHDLYKSEYSAVRIAKSNTVRSVLKRLFRKHGALHIATPLLLPRSTRQDTSEMHVCVMDRTGTLVTLPYDPKVPFARYVAKSGVTQLRRYCIDKVFSETRQRGSHPREITACSFDIVTPTNAGLVPDAEVIYVMFDLLRELPVFQKREYRLRLNHTLLLSAILLHCGIAVSQHDDVISVLTDTKREKKSLKIEHLKELSLSEKCIKQLFKFMEYDSQLEHVASELRCITKTQREAGIQAKKALSELRVLLSHVTALLGYKPSVHLTPGLLHSVRHYRGVMCQVVMETHKQRKRVWDVLAGGGRYDPLIEQFCPPGKTPQTQTAVGVNISFDKIVHAVLEDKGFEPETRTDVFITSLSHKANERLIPEKLEMLRYLRFHGISAQVLQQTAQGGEELVFTNLDEILDHCRTLEVYRLVIIRDADLSCLVFARDKDKFVEKKHASKENIIEQLVNVAEQNESSPGTIANTPVTTSGPTSSSSTNQSASQALRSMTIHFIQPENKEKFPKNQRRLFESRIQSSLTLSLRHMSSACKVQVLGLDLTHDVINTVASKLMVKDDESQFKASFSSIFAEHASSRRYLTQVFGVIEDLIFGFRPDEIYKSTVIILYAVHENFYRFLL